MASTLIARMIWVMLSVWICCTRGQQRRLIPIDEGDGEHDSNLDLDRCGNDDEQCQSAAVDRSLLSGGLVLFLRDAQTGVTRDVELEPSATVGDLRRAAAAEYGVSAGSVELHFGGEKMNNENDEELADIGVGMETTVEVHFKRNNDIDDFLQFIGDSIPAIWPDEQSRTVILERIDTMKREALQAAAAPNSVDFSDVIEYLNLNGHLVFELESKNGRISSVHIMQHRRVQLQPLKWQYLPEQTRLFQLKDTWDLGQISLADIECANLEHLVITNNLKLSHVDLRGIEKCTKLSELDIRDTRILDLSPLRVLRALQQVRLSWNGHTEMVDVSPLRECPVLRDVQVMAPSLSDGHEQRAKMEKEFKNAGFSIKNNSGTWCHPCYFVRDD